MRARVSSRIDTVSVENESYSIDKRPALSCTTQAWSRETGRRVQWARDVDLLRGRGLTLIRIRTCDQAIRLNRQKNRKYRLGKDAGAV